MKYLSPEQVLYIHFEVTEAGSGLRDMGSLLSALSRPRSSFGGDEAYPRVYEKAAVLLDSICRNQPFVDGNKRTGITAASLFLAENGHELTASNDEVVEFTMFVAIEKPDIPVVARWFEDHTVEVDDSAV